MKQGVCVRLAHLGSSVDLLPAHFRRCQRCVGGWLRLCTSAPRAGHPLTAPPASFLSPPELAAVVVVPNLGKGGQICGADGADATDRGSCWSSLSFLFFSRFLQWMAGLDGWPAISHAPLSRRVPPPSPPGHPHARASRFVQTNKQGLARLSVGGRQDQAWLPCLSSRLGLAWHGLVYP